MSEYVERYPGQHDEVLEEFLIAKKNGVPWLRVSDFQGRPIAGAVMALREQGKLQLRIGPTGRVEIAVREAASD